ncbi:aklavinone 12-hydroxylase RdmE [Actinosynnema sp. NPDC020468]|uniref:aklavinone 12-hydroxylase RdmE n=1 Tax=Actinosynnema sp. NPDC020468 TaxID=3154488 RepID=UPI0033ECE7B6
MGEDRQVEVLVVGAGLGGLSTALFLARLGVDVLGVAKHGGTSPHPKATGQTHRTMELYRVGGVADAVLEGSTGVSAGIVIKVAESLRGRVFHTIVHEADELDVGLSPERFGMTSQDFAEPVLLARARELGADIRFRTELRSFEQDATGVTAVLLDRETGVEQRVRARYLVGADGHRGPVREALGIARRGRGPLAHHVGVVFDAELSEHIAADKGTLYYLRNPAFTGAFVATNTMRRNVFTVEYDPARGESPADFPPERCVELLRVATDVPDLEPSIVDITSWEMAAWLADSFRSGRVFLVGDAAKVTPPTGGLGGNTAVGDGYDLAWKLAAVLRGEAGEALLDTYEAERRPYAKLVVDGSFHNYVQRMAPHLAGPDVPDAIDPTTLVLGYRHRSTAVLAEDDDPAFAEDPFHATGRPGYRVPHVVVRHAGREVSTVDFTGGWALLTADPAWEDAEVRVAVLEGDLDRLGVGAHGASLLRPDGVVAWRCAELPADPAGAVSRALDALLSR